MQTSNAVLQVIHSRQVNFGVYLFLSCCRLQSLTHFVDDIFVVADKTNNVLRVIEGYPYNSPYTRAFTVCNATGEWFDEDGNPNVHPDGTTRQSCVLDRVKVTSQPFVSFMLLF